MDKQTLEYMGTRVDRARELSRQIANLDKRTGRLIGDKIHSIVFHFKSDPDFFTNTENIIADAQPALVLAYQNYRNSLQNELDQL
jgi:hypothetical protein